MPSSSTDPATWQPTLGALPGPEGTGFRVWASRAQKVELVLETSSGSRAPSRTMTPRGDGIFEIQAADAGPGDRYRYQVDGEGPFPDPASRFQPLGVHGPSEIIDPRGFEWSDPNWLGVPLEQLVLYELHVGTFTPEGTFAAAMKRLPMIAGLGVTAIEIMPVADFPGARNWGYDGAALFSPARCYGTPDDFRRLVDAAHRIGLAVHLDVVYNHLGPDGAYLAAYAPDVFSDRHRSPWGQGINLDGPGSERVRDFFIENALHWIHEYHLDGLRLDATHAMVDEGPHHFLAELSDRTRSSRLEREVLLIAEDARNLAHMVKPVREAGWGMNAVWSDDFHHQMRRLLAGDDEGYYQDYSGSVADLATTVAKGWFFEGQRSRYWNTPRGTDPTGVPLRRMVVCIQNHDQIGNRALGERLIHQVDLAAYRAATVVLLMGPQTPLLFMGQEWAARTPFLFFSDHAPELGAQVTAGRRQEFKNFSAFADVATRQKIPDPQAESTFVASRLDWNEREREPHASTLRLHQALLRLRREESGLRGEAGWPADARALDDATLLVRREGAGSSWFVVARFSGTGEVTVPTPGDPRDWQPVLTTEDGPFAPDPRPLQFEHEAGALRIRFNRPSAVVMRAR